MKKEECYVGQRVQCVSSFADDLGLVGEYGTICVMENIWGEDWVGVAFDNKFGGHTCDGTCEYGHGRFGPAKCLVEVSETPTVTFSFEELI